MEELKLLEDLKFLEKLELKKIIRKEKSVRKNFMNESDEDFKRKFRVSKETVTEVVDMIETSLEHRTQMNNALSPVEQVLIALRYYACGSYQIDIAGTFNVSQPTVCRVVHRVTKAIAAYCKHFICLPKTTLECEEVSKAFSAMASFPCVIGALYCSHVRINSPGALEAEVFRNKNGFFSINIQIIVDANSKIRNVDAERPGGMKKDEVFQKSSAFSRISSQAVYTNYHLVGDSGYACEPCLLTPVLKPESDSEKRYNEAHSLTHQVAMQSNEALRQRFPCLNIGLSCKVMNVPAIIVACCVLHNIAIELGDTVPPIDPEIEKLLNCSQDQTDGIFESVTNKSGVRQSCPTKSSKRNNIINNSFS